MVYLELTCDCVFGFTADRFKTLQGARDAVLQHVQFELNGYALRWEKLDKYITVPGVVAGRFQLPSCHL